MRLAKMAPVNLITGSVNAGKTSELLSIHRRMGQGDGIALVKVFKDGVCIGQKIVRLTTGESRDFSFRKGYLPPGWDEEYRFNVYSFSGSGLVFAAEIMADLAEKGTAPVFIDEIGPLELQGRGFHSIFTALLDAGVEMYAVVRESCLDNVIKKFGIKNYRILHVTIDPAGSPV